MEFPILYPDAQVVRAALRGMAAYQLSWLMRISGHMRSTTDCPRSSPRILSMEDFTAACAFETISGVVRSLLCFTHLGSCHISLNDLARCARRLLRLSPKQIIAHQRPNGSELLLLPEIRGCNLHAWRLTRIERCNPKCDCRKFIGAHRSRTKEAQQVTFRDLSIGNCAL
jgi:hypothetical protein